MAKVSHSNPFLPDVLVPENDLKAARIEQLEALNAELLKGLKAIAGSEDAGLYESEYDGRVYMLCHGCNYQDDCRPQHSSDCDYALARVTIAKAEIL